jgi:hypothetical protein
MMRYLQRRGWIVFYWQDKSTLRCHDPHCILTLYLDQRKHGEPYA